MLYIHKILSQGEVPYIGADSIVLAKSTLTVMWI